MGFDPLKKRGWMEGEIGYRSDLAMDFNEMRTAKALQSCGVSFLGDAVLCAVVGLFEPARKLLLKVREWLEAAIEAQETPLQYYFPYGTESRRHGELSICNWLLTSEHDATNLREAVRLHDLYSSSAANFDKVDAQLALPLYADAGDYARVIEIFESTRGLKKPSNLRRIQGPGTMCYVIARQRLSLEYSADEVADAVDRFLRRHIPNALDHGYYIDVARWLKIGVWHPPGDAVQTLLNCYRFMPDVEPPPEVRARLDVAGDVRVRTAP